MSAEPKNCFGVRLSIVVPTRNRRDVLGRLFKSIAMQDRKDIEVIVVDDASSEPVTRGILDQAAPAHIRDRVQVLRLPRQGGQNAARNVGAAAALGEYVLFLDDDVELVGSDMCSRLLTLVDTNSDVAVVALAELAPDGGWGLNIGSADQRLEVARFYGFGVLFRRECLSHIGGFFEPLGYYYDEFEISMRVINAGYRIVFDPDLRVVHYRDPRGRDSRAIARLISRNAMLTAAARFPLWMVPPALAVQLTRFAGKCWLRRPRDLLGPLHAMAAAARRVPTILNQRRPVRAASLRRYRRLAKYPTPWKTVQRECGLDLETSTMQL